MMESDNSFKYDCALKHGNFIGKVHSLNQEFHFATSDVLTRLYEVYTLSFYGAQLYDLFREDVQHIHRSYNTSIRIAFRVDRTTRTFLIETLSNCLHPHTLMTSRFVKFHQTNMKCNKPVIRFLANLNKDDLRTVYGNNLHKIADICNSTVSELTPSLVKSNVKYREVPVEETWRIPILKEMIAARDNNVNIEELNDNDVNAILKYVCTV